MVSVSRKPPFQLYNVAECRLYLSGPLMGSSWTRMHNNLEAYQVSNLKRTEGTIHDPSEGGCKYRYQVLNCLVIKLPPDHLSVNYWDN